MRDDWPERPITRATTDDARTLAAMAAYQDALRRNQTWRAAIRAALAAADAVERDTGWPTRHVDQPVRRAPPPPRCETPGCEGS
jgi:hypothetical protein